jgi:hypothetical protein
MLENEDQLEKLRFRFDQLYLEYVQALGSASSSAPEIMAELEDVRLELVGTAAGVGFILERIGPVAAAVRNTGTLSAENEILFQACCGFGSGAATVVGGINSWRKRAQPRRIRIYPSLWIFRT